MMDGMTEAGLFLIAGIPLLATAALLGFQQARVPEHDAARRTLWRVVHAGGTTGGVQLLALSAVAHAMAPGSILSWLVAITLTAATWAFFLGPLARAVGHPSVARGINWTGACFAVPGYALLPLLLL